MINSLTLGGLPNAVELGQLTTDPELVAIYKEMLNEQTTLNLSRKEIGDVGAIALAEALKDNRVVLHTIDLRNNKIGPIGATALAQALKVNETIRKLDLSDNKIEDTGAIALSETLLANKILESLSLHYCKIGNAGATAIASALIINKTLYTLELLYNEIGEEGGSSLATAMKTNGMLTTFTQFGNKISSGDRETISQELQRNRRLGIHKNVLSGSIESNRVDMETKDSWKISHQEKSIDKKTKDDYWTLYNSEKHPGKLKEIAYSLEYKEVSQFGYDSYGEWCAIKSSGREPTVKISLYIAENSQQAFGESDLITSLAQSDIIIEKKLSSDCLGHIDFIVRSPNFFTLEKILICFVQRGYLTKEKSAEFLKKCSER